MTGVVQVACVAHTGKHKLYNYFVAQNVSLLVDVFNVSGANTFKCVNAAPKRWQSKRSPIDLGGPVVIILTFGFEVRGFDPGRGQWIFSERKNPEYDFLRKGSKAVGPMS